MGKGSLSIDKSGLSAGILVLGKVDNINALTLLISKNYEMKKQSF